jgi:hypothetical protein
MKRERNGQKAKTIDSSHGGGDFFIVPFQRCQSRRAQEIIEWFGPRRERPLLKLLKEWRVRDGQMHMSVFVEERVFRV